MRTLYIATGGTFMIALMLWGGFWFLVWTLYTERAEYAQVHSATQEEALRSQSIARLRATVHDTEVERAALESVFQVGILDTVELLEATGRQAGGRNVTIGNASPLTAPTPQGVGAYAMVVNVEGAFTSLVRAASLFETLAIPATLEQFELEKTDATWRLIAHLRVLLATDTL